MNICLKDTKSFVNCIKTQQKLCKKFGLSYFMIQVIKGSKEIKIITCNEAYCIDNNYKFSEFSFELKESSEFSGNYFYIFDTALKCIDDWNGNLYFDGIKLSFGTKVVDICFCMSVQDINKYFDKYSIGTIKPNKLTKIKRGKPIAQYTDDMLELVSLDLSSMTYVVNGDIGTAKNIRSIVLYDEIGKIVVFFEDGEKRECLFDGESILQSVLKRNVKYMDTRKGKTLHYVSKDGVKFTTWKYSACEYCFYLDKKTDIVKTLLLSDSERMQGFFYKGYFVKNILKPQKQKFLPGNFYQFIYKLVYVGYKMENGKRLKMYQLKQMAFYPEVR